MRRARYDVSMNRRDMLRMFGASAAGLALGCGDDLAFRTPGSGDGSAVLEPEHDSFVVSLWSSSARYAKIEVRDPCNIVLATTVGYDAAGQAMLHATGLAPATAYQVTAQSDAGVRLVHQVRTAPAPADPRPVRLTVGADLDPSPEFTSDLLDRMIATEADLHVSIGDFPYTDNGPPAMTVAEYRARHAELRTAPRVRPWIASVGMRAIYDDHEFRNNWDAMFVQTEHDRYVAAVQVWDEFFPLPGAPPEIRYRSWRYGAHVECFLLDTRRFRSADDAPDDAAKTMLGKTQLAWLLAGVAASQATFKLIFTTIPLDFATGNDAWDSFSTERDAMLAALAAARTPGILFVSGDQHFFAAHRHAHGIREFQIGPLARGLGMPGPNAPGVLFRSVQYNFGQIDVSGDALVFRGIGSDGAFYEETLTPEQLTPA
jgi:alkaline phosphatase D